MLSKQSIIRNIFRTKISWAIFLMAFFVGLSIFSLTLSIKIVLAADDNANESYCALPIDDCDNWSYYCTDYGFSWCSGCTFEAGHASCCGDDSGEYYINCIDRPGASCDNKYACCDGEWYNRCVYNGSCYSPGGAVDTNDSSSDLEFCAHPGTDFVYWMDQDTYNPDDSRSACRFVWFWDDRSCINAGPSGVCDDAEGNSFCCGDDPNEKSVPSCSGTSNAACCPSSASYFDSGSGQCVSSCCTPACYSNADCQDGLVCTTNICNNPGTCSASCSTSLDSGWCVIGGTCYANGFTNPSNSCQECNTSNSYILWTNKSNGTSCSDEGNSCTRDYCSSGLCLHSLYCSGTDTSCGCTSCGNCNSSDGWYNVGGNYACCNGNQRCTCQDQEYSDYYCEGYSCNDYVTDSRDQQSNCQCVADSCDAECSAGNTCSSYQCDDYNGQTYFQVRAASCQSNCTCRDWSAYQDCEDSYDYCQVECYEGTGCNTANNACYCQSGYHANGSGGCSPDYTYSWYTGSWGSCGGFSDTCDETGTQSRDVYCRRSDGQQVDDSYCSGSKPSSSQSCTRDTDGTSCGTTTYGSWGTCSDFSDTCDETGTQSRTVTSYTCSNGSCPASSSSQTQSCTRDTDGTSCGTTTYGSWSSCSGFSDTCDESGTQSRTVTTYTCSNGSCPASTTTQTQSCSRDTDGTSCDSAINYCYQTTSCDTHQHYKSCQSGSCSTSVYVNDSNVSGTSCSGQSCGSYSDYCLASPGKLTDYVSSTGTCSSSSETCNPPSYSDYCQSGTCSAECSDGNTCSSSQCTGSNNKFYQTRSSTCQSNCLCPAWGSYGTCQQSYNNCGQKVECYTGTGCDTNSGVCACQSGYHSNGSGGCAVNETYYWDIGSWSSCSVECGTGTQTRNVVCRQSSDDQQVADSNCSGSKPATSQSCDAGSCAPTTCPADGCYGTRKWYDYPASVSNSCQSGSCTHNSCTATQTCSISQCGAECQSNNCSTSQCDSYNGQTYLQTRSATCGSDCLCPAWSAYQSCQQSYNNCDVECYTGTGCNTATNACYCQSGYHADGSGGCASNDVGGPTITFNPISRSWANTNVSVTVTASDPSGVSSTLYCWTTSASCTPSTTFTNGSAISQSSNGDWNLCVKATDTEGNATTDCSGRYQIDKTNPTASFAGDGSTCEQITWTISSASDSGGSGLHSQPYSFDGASWQAVNTYTETVSGGGSRTRTARVRDIAGNQWTSSPVTVTTSSCDTNAPTITFNPTSRSWANSDVSVTVTASDSSGVTYTRHCWTTSSSCDPGTASSSTFSNGSAITQTSNGDWNLCIRARDGEGNWNLSPVCSGRYQIDKTNPSVDSFNVNGNTSNFTTLDTSLEVNYTVRDSGGSGLDQAEVWRKTDSGSWSQVYSDPSPSGNGPVSGSWTDNVTCGHTYSYGLHVKDMATNCSLENNTSCGGAGSPITATVNCPAGPDFSISNSPASRTINVGESATYTITLTSLNGFSSSVSLSTTGCPAAGATCSFSPLSVVPTGNSTLTISNAGVGGPYTITITGIGGSKSHDTSVILTVQSAGPGPDLIAPTVTIFEVDNKKCATVVMTHNDLDSAQRCPNTVTNSNGKPKFNWAANDTGGSGLKQVEIWWTTDQGGTPNAGAWQIVANGTFTSATGNNWEYPSTLSAGTYWFGIHAVDNAGNCITGTGTHCGGVSSDSLDPRVVANSIKVVVGGGGPNQPPVANFTACKVDANTIRFTDTSTDDGGIVSRDWDFGDSTAHSSLQNPTHNYQTGGTSLAPAGSRVAGVEIQEYKNIKIQEYKNNEARKQGNNETINKKSIFKSIIEFIKKIIYK